MKPSGTGTRSVRAHTLTLSRAVDEELAERIRSVAMAAYHAASSCATMAGLTCACVPAALRGGRELESGHYD